LAGSQKGRWHSNWEVVSFLIVTFYFYFYFFHLLKLTCAWWGRLPIVWDEALAQIGQMLQYYDKKEAIDTTYGDFNKVALGVIAHAGFSKVMEWVPLTTAITNKKYGERSYQKCFNILFENLLWTVIAPSWVLGQCLTLPMR